MHQGGNGKAFGDVDEERALGSTSEPLRRPQGNQVAGAGAGATREADPAGAPRLNALPRQHTRLI
jgi:hypothetical protein